MAKRVAVTETLEWIDADGGTTVLAVEWAVTGRFAPPPEYEEEGVPDQPGVRLRSVRHGPREFAIPVWIEGTSETDLRTKMRNLVAAMDPIRGDGRLRVTGPSGDQREVTCRYQAGLEMNETLGDTSGLTAQKAAIVFRAHDPYWYDVSATVAEYTVGLSPTFFPFFPMRLTSSEVFAETSVTNAGDVEVWPVWVIKGPGQSINLRNLTTGKDLKLDANTGVTLMSGETVTIDTRPGYKTVVKNDSTNLFDRVNTLSSLWPLRRGANALSLEMSGSSAASSITLTRKHRYLSA